MFLTLNKRPRQTLRVPRRRRRGSSLFEFTLFMILAVPVVRLVMVETTNYARDRAGLSEARLLTNVVDAGATLALRNLSEMINTEIGAGNAIVLDLSDLETEGLWTMGSTQLTALSRDVSLILHARGSDELVLMARATARSGETNPAYVPMGGEGVGLVGYVPPDDTDALRGPGINYDLSGIQSLIGAPVAWDIVALRVLRMDRDVLPFLYRVAVPGHPELNRMSTDLDMNGFDVIGVGALDTTSLTVANEIEAGAITGTLTIDGDVAAAGDLDVSGTLSAGDTTINGTASVDTLTVANQASFEALTVTTLTTGGSVSIAQDLVVGGTATLDTLAAPDLTVQRIETQTMTAGTVAADSAFAATASATDGIFENLNAGSCTGC